MIVARLTGIDKVETQEVDEPALAAPDEVKLRVETVGVCGSDMHYYRVGRIGDQVVEFPWPVGHEFSAEVVEVGQEVTNVKVGDRVAVDPLVSCGRCDQCLAGREHTCRSQAFMGCPGQLAGCLAERVVLPARCCFAVPAELTATQTALIEPFSIALHAQRLAGDVAGKTVAVLGSGPVGLCILVALRAAGAAAVYMTDIRDYRAELAGRMGATWAGNPQSENIVEAILRAQPTGVDFAYECAGEQDTIDQCVEVLTPGGTCLLVGIPETDRVSFEMTPMRRKELQVRNVRRQNRCVQPAIDMVASGEVDLDSMVTHRFGLSEAQKAFDTVAYYRDSVVKAMIDL